MADTVKEKADKSMSAALEEHEGYIELPEVGEILTGTIIDKARNALYVDLGSLGVGVIYGHELIDDEEAFKSANLGDPIQAQVARFDNEDDLIELSVRSANREKSWNELRQKMESGEIFETEVLDANKGGLLVRVHGVTGFLPVSQLAPDNYPRVEGGDKSKILDRLKELIGKKLRVKVIGAEQDSEKLIVSEKSALSDEMSGLLEKIEVGEVVSGTVSGIVDFGVFVKFMQDDNELEGLVHISELAWQRIDDPSDYVSMGDTIKAKVIGVDGLRISLSIKQLQEDPWKQVAELYSVGDSVSGEVIKVTPFGGFVKLDKNIHGLVHISELPEEAQADPASVLKVGSKQKFKIISMQPEEHRLGLSLLGGSGKTKDTEPEATSDLETSEG